MKGQICWCWRHDLHGRCWLEEQDEKYFYHRIQTLGKRLYQVCFSCRILWWKWQNMIYIACDAVINCQSMNVFIDPHIVINAVRATRVNLSFHWRWILCLAHTCSSCCYVILLVVAIIFYFCSRTACAIELNWRLPVLYFEAAVWES